MTFLTNPGDRRSFLKKGILGSTPLFFPFDAASILPKQNKDRIRKREPAVNFVFDGLGLSPNEYLEKVREIHQNDPIEKDFYGQGGAVEELEEAFAKITGKENAIFLPSGTMANQIAIKLLNRGKTKVIVPDNSHIFRDEADAAQSVHRLRLVPVGQGKPYFELDDLKGALDYLQQNEVFESGTGTVVIEHPIRRADGTVIPVNVIEEICEYCKGAGYKTHLDGARLHIASAYSGISIQQYASYFDTVYISLYKYLNSGGGAILCGNESTISQVAHQIKILGGTILHNWMYASVALHYLKDIDSQWQSVIQKSEEFIKRINNTPVAKIESVQNGSNVYNLRLSDKISLRKLANYFYEEQNILLGRADEYGVVKLKFNASILRRNVDELANAWLEGIDRASE